jgi:hypothetical protein
MELVTEDQGLEDGKWEIRFQWRLKTETHGGKTLRGTGGEILLFVGYFTSSAALYSAER